MSNLKVYLPVNIQFFNDKNIKKISLNCKTLNVLTYDGVLYQSKTEELQQSQNIDEIIFIKCCEKCGEIEDFDIAQQYHSSFEAYDGQLGLLVNKKGKIFEVQSFEKSLVSEFDSSFTENEHIVNVVVSGHLLNAGILLSKMELDLNIQKNPHTQYVLKKK